MIELRKEKRKNHVVIREDDVKIDAIIKLFHVHFVGLNKNVRNRHNCKTYDFFVFVCLYAKIHIMATSASNSRKIC